MNLLLLLSALLSALTGAGQVARAGAAPQAVCASAVAARPVHTAAAIVARRPVQPPPAVGQLAALVRPTFVLRPAVPIFAGRRRE